MAYAYSITSFFRKDPDTNLVSVSTQEPSLSLSKDTLTAEGSQPTSAKSRSHRGTYDPHWEIDFPWIRYEPNHDNGPSMFCTICQKAQEVKHESSMGGNSMSAIPQRQTH